MYQLFYTINLIFILTNLYGWLLKWFYKAGAYKEHFALLFPGQRIVGTLYLVQIFEIPYLLMISKPEALFYVNAFSVLVFPALMIMMCKAYFFLKLPSVKYRILYFLPTAFFSLFLLLVALGRISLCQSDKRIVFWVITGFVGGYMYLIIKEQLKIRRRIRNLNELSYSSQSDFPVSFAQQIEWIPLGISLLLYVNFAADDTWVKMVRDIILTVTNVWFMFYTLNPHRQLAMKREQMDPSNTKFRLSEKRCNELQKSIFETIRNEKLYLESHFSIDSLARKIGTNKNYISEAFVRSHYRSFYRAINYFRIEYAAEQLLLFPENTIEDIAKSSGFSSASLFSRLFKQYKGISPSQFSSKNTNQ